MNQLFTDEQTIVDRSTLERWAECPQAGWQAQHVKLNAGIMAEIGSAVHGVISQAVAARVDGMAPRDLSQLMIDAAEVVTPNVQPQALKVIRRSAYKLGRLICFHDNGSERHPDDILRFDGGEGDRSGQLAAELKCGDDSVLYTGEMDLLTAGPSIHEVDLTDWKSGWKWYTATAIAESFQFNSYAWLIFNNFPSVNRVNVRVAMLSEGATSSIVPIDRDEYGAIESRLSTALGLMLRYRSMTVAGIVPGHPTPERCGICDLATRCALCDHEGKDVADVGEYLKSFVAITAKGDRMKTRLTQIVRSQGADIESGELAFGTGKPKATRPPTCDVYELS